MGPLACFLLTVFGSGLLLVQVACSEQESSEDPVCNGNLYEELDYKHLIPAYIEWRLLQVPYKDAIRIGRMSVTEILSYRNTSCDLKRLEDPLYFDYEDYRCPATNQAGYRINEGIHAYMERQTEKRKKSCAEMMLVYFKDAWREIPLEDRETALQFMRHVERVIERRPCRIIEPLKRYIPKTKKKLFNNRDYKKAKRDKLKRLFSSCALILHKLSRFHSCSYWDDVGPADDVLFAWYKVVEACQSYVAVQCKPVKKFKKSFRIPHSELNELVDKELMPGGGCKIEKVCAPFQSS